MKYEDLEPGKVYERGRVKYKKLDTGMLYGFIGETWKPSGQSFEQMENDFDFTELPPEKKKVSKTFYRAVYVDDGVLYESSWYRDKTDAIARGYIFILLRIEERTETWEE